MKTLSYAWVLSLLLGSSVALAASEPVQATGRAITAALEKFSQEHAAHAAGFQGVKGWPSGDKIQVKVYLPENAFVEYSCYEHVMNGENMVMCDAAR